MAYGKTEKDFLIKGKMAVWARKVLEEQGFTELTLELPLTVAHEKAISNKFDKSYMTASVKS